MVSGFGFQRLIVKIYVHICQDAALGLHLFDPLQRGGQIKMRRVRRAAQGIQHPDVQILQMGQGVVRDFGHIRQVGQPFDPEAQRVDTAVIHLKWSEGDGTACALNRHIAINGVHVQNRRIGAALGLHKGIAEPRQQRVLGITIRPDGQPAAHVENNHAQVIQTMHVIGMGVGPQNRIQFANASIQQLLAHIRRGIDQHPGGTLIGHALYHHGTAAAGVFGVIWITLPPDAANARHPTGGAAAQNGKPQLSHQAAAS